MRLQLILNTLKHTLDSETLFHSMNLKRIVLNFMNFGNYNTNCQIGIDTIKEACLLHDIGKSIPIVKKYIVAGVDLPKKEIQDKITTIHIEKGERQLKRVFKDKDLKFKNFIYNVINFHHEPWSKLQNIPDFHNDEERLICNIIRAFDILESLTSPRKYRIKNFQIEEALTMLNETDKIHPEIMEHINDYLRSSILC